MSQQNYSYLFKFIVIGDSGVGKSCLVLQFIENKIREQHDITIGVEFGAKLIKLADQNIKIQIWDTAGQENFRSITRSYYRSAIGALLVYDITKRESFEHLQDWLNEMKENGNPLMQIILVGNKSDLENNRQVSFQEGKQFAEENNLIFIETSAKEAVNVNNSFVQCCQAIYDKIESDEIPIKSQPQQTYVGIKIGSEFKQQFQAMDTNSSQNLDENSNKFNNNSIQQQQFSSNIQYNNNNNSTSSQLLTGVVERTKKKTTTCCK